MRLAFATVGSLIFVGWVPYFMHPTGELALAKGMRSAANTALSSEAYETITDFIRHYNSRRIHSSLGYRTPDECYCLLQNQDVQLDKVRA